jgi:hypothetical protein
MIGRLFPQSLGGGYRGSWAAVWLLVPVLAMKTMMGFNFRGLNPFVDVGEILRTVDGVPLETFSPAAAASVLDSAGAWGMALFSLCLLVWIILARYRAGLPLAILMLLVEQVGRTGADTIRLAAKFAAGTAHPAAGAFINLGMTALLVLALGLSLLAVRPATTAAPTAERPRPN